MSDPYKEIGKMVVQLDAADALSKAVRDAKDDGNFKRLVSGWFHAPDCDCDVCAALSAYEKVRGK